MIKCAVISLNLAARMFISCYNSYFTQPAKGEEVNTSTTNIKAMPNKIQLGEYKSIVYLMCLIAALGGLLFGLDQGFIANSLPTIRKVYGLDIIGGEKYAAILASGGVVGALLSGVLSRILGRKKSLILSGFLFSSLSLLSATLPTLAILSACRFGLGFAVGVASFVVPLYLAETAPASIRGSMGSLFQLMITIGIFLIATSNLYLSHRFSNSQIALPLMFIVISLFSIIMFCGSFIIPESPRWLILKGRPQQARQVLAKLLNSSAEIELELSAIQATLATDKNLGFFTLFKGYFWKILLLGVILQMLQQLVGINLMIYYAPTIFAYAGMKGFMVMLSVPTINMLSTFPAIYLVERWGRKKLLYLGAIIMGLTLIMAGLAFYSIDATPNQIGLLPKITLLSAIIFYIFGFAVSWGPVAWLICSEIFPLEVREIGMTITTVVNWTFAGLVMGNALSFMNNYGKASIFFVFAGFCILAMLFLKFFTPETKGISLENLEQNLKKGKSLKSLGNI
jgi:SP family galactose:H+ symporter-like MFS transporter